MRCKLICALVIAAVAVTAQGYMAWADGYYHKQIMGKDFDKGSPNDANYESPKRESSEFPNEGCELSVGDKPCYAWWIFQLPYDKAGRYKKLEVGIYAKEKGWLGNGPTLYVYNWQQEEWDLVFTNKRTNGWSGWQEIDPTHGKYTHPQFDKVALLIYADGLDHIHVKYVAVQAQYADRPKAYVTADVGNKIQIGPEGRKITITVKNEGGPADYMYLTVSYSKNLKVVEKDSQERWKYYPPGSEVAGRTGKRETKYPMHEATVEHYGTGTKTYWLKFKKIDDGEGWIKYRVAMNPEGRIPNGIDPDTFSRYPTSGSEDQQGWYAVEIKVIEPSMIVVNDPLKFGKVHKGKYPQKDLKVYNFGSWGSLLDWEATPQDTWISIAPSSGTGVKRGKYDKVSVEIDTNRVSNPPGEIIFTATNIWNKPQQTVEINIEVVGPPTITCTVPTVAIVDEDVKLKASADCPAGHSIVEYEWNFGDGGKSSDRKPRHRWTSTGTYIVKVKAKCSDGVWSNWCEESIHIIDHPTADPNGPYGGAPGETVTFDGSGSRTYDGKKVDEYLWTFWDGSTSNEEKPRKQIPSDKKVGEKLKIKLKVRARHYGTDVWSEEKETYVEVKPHENLNVDSGGPYYVGVNQELQLKGKASGPLSECKPFKWKWDFGDGNTASEQNPKHTWTKTGNYPVKLTVTCQHGVTTVVKTTVHVLAGIIEGWIKAPDGKTPVEGVTVSLVPRDVSPVITDSNGYFKFENLQLKTYKVAPYKKEADGTEHEFEPTSREVTIDEDHLEHIANFKDKTVFPVSGTTKFKLGLKTGVPDVEVTAVNIKSGAKTSAKTNQNGEFSMSLPIGEYDITPNRDYHKFDPPTKRLLVTAAVNNVNFTDITSRKIVVEVLNSSGDPVEGVSVSVGGRNASESKETGSDGKVMFTVPPGKYTVTAEKSGIEIHPKEGYDIDVEQNDWSGTFRIPVLLKLEIKPDPLDNAIEEGQEWTYEIEIKDENGKPVSGATLEIVDWVEFTEETGTPEKKEVHVSGSSYSYKTKGGRPGIDKKITFKAKKGGYYDSDDEKHGGKLNVKIVTVTGDILLGKEYVISLPEIVYFILYDPPGDRSYAWREESKTHTGFLGVALLKKDGTEAKIYASRKVRGILDTARRTLGGAAFHSIPKLAYDMAGIISLLSAQYDVKVTERIETPHSSSDGAPELKGPGHGDVFYGEGLNLVLARIRRVYIDPKTKKPQETEVIGYNIDRSYSRFLYTAEDVKQLVDPNDPRLKPEQKAVWRKWLKRDVALDNEIKNDERKWVEEESERITFTSGVGYDYERRVTIGETFEVAFQVYVSAEVSAELGLKVLGTGIGGSVKVGGTIAIGGNRQLGMITETATGFHLEDDEGEGDKFTIVVCKDATWGTPIFITKEGSVSSDPWEPWTSKNVNVELHVVAEPQLPVDYHDSADYTVQAKYTGLRENGATFKIYAPASGNPEGTTVLFNGQHGPFIFNLSKSKPTVDIKVSIKAPSADQKRSENKTYPVRIQVEELKDPQIFAYQSIEPEFADLIPPKAIIISPEDGSYHNEESLTVKASSNDADVAKVLFQWRRKSSTNGWTTWANIGVDTKPDSKDPWIFSILWKISALPDGQYQLRAIATDKATNPNSDPEPQSITIILDHTPPEIVSTKPDFKLPEEKRVYKGEISVIFSEGINASSVTKETILVRKVGGEQIAGNVSYNASQRKVIFSPMVLLEENQQYIAIVKGGKDGVRDKAGNSLSKDFTWSWHTEDTTPPLEPTNVKAVFDPSKGITVITWIDEEGEKGETYRIFRHHMRIDKTNIKTLRPIADGIPEGTQRYEYRVPPGTDGYFYYAVVSVDSYGNWDSEPTVSEQGNSMPKPVKEQTSKAVIYLKPKYKVIAVADTNEFPLSIYVDKTHGLAKAEFYISVPLGLEFDPSVANGNLKNVIFTDAVSKKFSEFKNGEIRCAVDVKTDAQQPVKICDVLLKHKGKEGQYEVKFSYAELKDTQLELIPVFLEGAMVRVVKEMGYVGDFDQDSDIDVDDASYFIDGWIGSHRPQNPKYNAKCDIAPLKQGAQLPYLITDIIPDKSIDIQDASVFIDMWIWAHLMRTRYLTRIYPVGVSTTRTRVDSAELRLEPTESKHTVNGPKFTLKLIVDGVTNLGKVQVAIRIPDELKFDTSIDADGNLKDVAKGSATGTLFFSEFKNDEIRLVSNITANASAPYEIATIQLAPSDKAGTFYVKFNEDLSKTSLKDTEGNSIAISTFKTAKVIIEAGANIKLISPNGGERWAGESKHEIKWDSSGKIDHVTLFYSTDGGKSWMAIAHPVNNTGKYNWAIPKKNSSKCYVKVEAHDANHNVLASDASDEVFIIDSTPPSVEIISPKNNERVAQGMVKIEGKGTDSLAGIAKVELYINGNKVKEFTYEGQPKEVDWSYKWDTSGLKPGSEHSINVKLYDCADPANIGEKLIKVNITGQVTHILNAGLHMVSIPYQLSNADWKIILGEQNPKVAKWCTERGDYRYYPDAPVKDAVLGQAYWIKLDTDKEVSIAGTPPDESKEFTIELSAAGAKDKPQGWNMIGVPWVVNWANLKVRKDGQEKGIVEAGKAGWVSDLLWVWNSETKEYKPVWDANIVGDVIPKLEPWQGYWIRAKVDCVLVISPKSKALRGLRGKVDRSGITTGWIVSLQVHGLNDLAEAFMGIVPALATRSRGSRVELPSPPSPPINKQLHAFFIGRDGRLITMDIRTNATARSEWDFIVQRAGNGRVSKSIAPQRQFILRWSGIGCLPKNLRITLMDMTTGKRLYMRTNAGYQFIMREGELVRQFKVIVERNNVNLLRIINLRAKPMRGRGVMISFALTKPAKVTIRVVTLTGRIVSLVEANRTRCAGENSVVWHRISNAGNAIPPGVYVIRVHARDEQGNQVQAVTMARLR